MPGAGRSRLERTTQLGRAVAQPAQLGLGLVEQLQRLGVRRHQVVQRRSAVGKSLDHLLQPVHDVGWAGAHDAAAATLPRMPLMNLPASSPEKVLASSMDSLMAALVGTCRSTVSSYTAMRRMMRSTFAICCSFQCSEASPITPSSFSWLASTPRTSSAAKSVTSAGAAFSLA